LKTIDLPFRPEFKERMLEGIKTATSRTRQYGEPGDSFSAFGANFTIEKVLHIPLRVVINYWHRSEGFSTPQGFMECWAQIHPRAKFDLDTKVFLHQFKIAVPDAKQETEK
jgi:hypothetical protein